MITGSEVERVEVELLATGDEPASRPRPPQTAWPDPDGSPGRRRGRVGVAVVAAAIILIGWTAARTAGDDRSEPPDAAAGSSGGATEAGDRDPVGADRRDGALDADRRVGGQAPSGDPADRADTAPDEAPSASPLVPIAPVTPALGDAEPIVVEVVGVSAVLASQPVEVVAYGNGRQLTRLDLSTGMLRTQVVQRHAFGRAWVLAGSDWLLLPSPDDDLPSVVVTADGTVELVDFGADRTVLGVTDLEQIWLSGRDDVAAGGIVEAADVGGESIATIELPGPPSQFDPRGGFVVETETGTTQVTAKGSAPITAGDLVALGTDRAVVRECVVTSRCEVVVVDRDSGERRGIEPFRSGGGAPELDLVRGESVARDGRHAMVSVLDPLAGSTAQATLGTLDLVTGEVVEIGPAQHIEQSTWSPDGRFLFYNSGGRIRAFDTTSDVEIVVSDRLLGVDSFAIRPALPDEGFPTP